MNRDGPYWNDFWTYAQRLAQEHPLVIDRPKGSSHPHYPELIYPLDYGYLEGTTAVDGGGLDVWRGSLPQADLSGLLATIDLFKADAEIKLLLGCSAEDIDTILAFLNGHAMRAVVMRSPLDFLDVLHSRRSVRRFKTQPIPPELIKHLLRAAIQAPSAHNRQPWRFAVLTSAKAKKRLAQAMGADFRRDLLANGLSPDQAEAQVQRSYDRINEAPAAIVLCLDQNAGDTYPDAGRQLAETMMGVQGVAMAGENLLLAAHALGLGGVWMCAPLFVQATVRQALQLPDSWQPQGLILLGFPARPGKERQRYPLEAVCKFL